MADYDSCASLDDRYANLKQLGIVSVLDGGAMSDSTYAPRYRAKLDVAAFCKWVESSSLFTPEEVSNLLIWAARDGAKKLRT